MKDLSRIKTYGCVVAGAGPAGMGFLFNALKSGHLPQLARHGLLIIDANDTPEDTPLGAGRLGEYRITANSVSDVFLDCLRDPALAEVLAPLEDDPCLVRIREQPHEPPALSEVGALLEAASELVLTHVTALHGVELWRGTSLDTLQRTGEDSLLSLSHLPRHARRPSQIRTPNLVLNLGGFQCPEHLVNELSRQGLSLSSRSRIYSGDEMLRMPSGQLRSLLLPRLRRGGRISVIGGSHSAFSMLGLLSSALIKTRINDITLLHRSPIRLSFENAEAANAAGYSFDASRDVCPVSGRINPSSGLRHREFTLAQEILATGYLKDFGIRIHSYQTGVGPHQQIAAAQEALSDSPAVIQCNGYQPILPSLKDATHRPLTLATTREGLDTDAAGIPKDTTGNRLEGLYLFGLGAGPVTDLASGSKTSFNGHVHDVWQFHHNASLSALTSIMERLAAQKLATHTTPCSTPSMQATR